MEIESKEDIRLFVDAFYAKVRVDPLIGPVFAARIENDNWTPHLERMYSFWNTVLFAERDYHGNPFSKHSSLPIQAEHFQRWIQLLNMTLDELFHGVKADEVKKRAELMGKLFQSKLEHIRKNNDGYKNIV